MLTKHERTNPLGFSCEMSSDGQHPALPDHPSLRLLRPPPCAAPTLLNSRRVGPTSSVLLRISLVSQARPSSTSLGSGFVLGIGVFCSSVHHDSPCPRVVSYIGKALLFPTGGCGGGIVFRCWILRCFACFLVPLSSFLALVRTSPEGVVSIAYTPLRGTTSTRMSPAHDDAFRFRQLRQYLKS